jgi:glycoside/pentoside/hexuronide:cation symporter, GPH family
MTDLLKNRPWIILFFISLILLIYVFIRSGSILYYFEYYLGNKKLATAFMFSGTVVVLLGTFITKELTRFISKKRLFILSMIIITLSLAGTYIAKPNQIVLIFALQILFSLGSGPTMPLLWSMYADVADYSEWKTGRRATGLVFSASTFAIKFGAAIGGAAILWLLAFYNYEPNVIQPEKTLNGIRLLMSVYPAFGAFVVLLLLFFYNLDQQKLTIISKELMDKKNLAE